jgi:hypothetical protein
VVVLYGHASDHYYLPLNAECRVRPRPVHVVFVVEESDPEKSVRQSNLLRLTPLSIIPPLPHTNVHVSVADPLILVTDRVFKQNTSPLPNFSHLVWINVNTEKFLYSIEIFENITVAYLRIKNSLYVCTLGIVSEF